MKRAFGCAAVAPMLAAISGVHSRPRQSIALAVVRRSCPPTTPPSGVSATLVKIVLRDSVSIAIGLVFLPVPGATPKPAASGLMARRRPAPSGLIHAMSSPTVETFHPLLANAGGGMSIAKFVLPQAPGTPLRCRPSLPSGFSTPRMSMLGHPALIAGDRRGDAQRETLLAEQRVAAVARASSRSLVSPGSGRCISP